MLNTIHNLHYYQTLMRRDAHGDCRRHADRLGKRLPATVRQASATITRFDFQFSGVMC
jgi:hypothetical protein